MAKNVQYDVTVELTGVTKFNEFVFDKAYPVGRYTKSLQIERTIGEAKKVMRNYMMSCTSASIKIRERVIGRDTKPSKDARTIHLNPAIQ